jgi:UDP-glucose 4-epimerase
MGVPLVQNHPGHYVYSLGSGKGYSVREIISAVERITGKTIKTVIGPKRSGDSPRRIANIQKTTFELGWTPLNDLDKIVYDAHMWYTSKTFKQLQSKLAANVLV